jgi:hypothetical protein
VRDAKHVGQVTTLLSAQPVVNEARRVMPAREGFWRRGDAPRGRPATPAAPARPRPRAGTPAEAAALAETLRS